MRKTLIIPIIIILISFIAGAVLYSYMPERMASHWNVAGEVDGYISKFWGLFLMPIISLGMLLLFIFLIQIDPLKQNIQKFRKYYDGFIIAIIAFLFYLYILTLLWNFNIRFNMIQILSPAFAVLFYYMGVLVAHSRRNWFIGIRTPWTLSSDTVWAKTHKQGGRMFKAVSFLALLGIVFPNQAIFFIIPPMIAVSIYLIIYSYVEYKKENKR
jgi:uncharacterized membrane protein